MAKVIEFEKAARDTVLDGRARVVRFSADPFPLPQTLTEGRLPDVIPQEFEYEIELKPDGPVTLAFGNRHTRFWDEPNADVD